MPTQSHTITMMNDTTVTVLFGEATAEQQIECYTLSSASWGSYLDEDEVVAREQHLSKTALARDGGCRSWCLYRQDDHKQIVSTCKTIRRDFLLKEAGALHQVKGYCIASVHTALLYRGHGLASFLLRNVAEWLDGSDGASVSLLYSGMPQFYAKLGWKCLPNMETRFSISPWLQDAWDSYADIEVRPLRDVDVKELCAQDVELLWKNSHSIPEDEIRITVLPTADLINYQHALSDYMGDLWHSEAPGIRGAAYKTQAWLCWYHDFRTRCLYVQRIHDAIDNADERSRILAALLLGAVREAKEWNFTTIATWDTNPCVHKALDDLAQASVFSRSVSESQRTQRIHVRLQNRESDPSHIVMDNETYAWNLRY